MGGRAVDEHVKHRDTKTQNLMARASDEVREGVAATQRAVIERCQIRAAPRMNVRFRGKRRLLDDPKRTSPP